MPLRQVVLAIQLTLPRAAVGWLFAILTSNYNRIAIHELGIAAVTITTLLALYHFLSPFQVVFGRMTDRFPIFGYRRSPYVLLGLVLSSLAVAGLPSATLALSEGAASGLAAVFALLVLFGVGFAMSGVSHLALVADVTPERRRGLQVALIWAMLLVGMIISLAFIRSFMPVFDFQRMQMLYALTIPVVLVVTLLGLLGVEKPRRPDRPAGDVLKEDVVKQDAAASLLGFVRAAAMRPATRNFFLFILISLLGIGVQENILEVFGAEVLGMTVGETGRFQQLWGGGALLGMFLMGVAALRWSISKQASILAGCLGISASLALLAWGAQTADGSLVLAALVAFGFFNGFFLVGALTAMMEMTTKRDRGAYMGLWGLALALANGLASIIGGALVTGLIESGLAPAGTGYAGIFLLEAVLVLVGLLFMRRVDIHGISPIRRGALTDAMAADL